MARRGKRGGRKVREREAKNAKARSVGEGLTPAVLDAVKASLTNYDGARPSERRGWVSFSQPDSKTELTRGARREVLRKARWGYANIGLVRRVVDGLTNLIGYLTPQSKGTDGDLYEDAWRRRAMQPNSFDMAGRLDARKWQRAMTRMRLLDGDNLTVLAEGSEGGARILFYESPQVDSGNLMTGDIPENLHDGVFIDRFGRHTAYRLVSKKGSGEESYSRVAADRAIYHANEEAPGRIRNVSSLAHAISNIVDIVEILADTKHGIKIAAQWGVVMTTQQGATGPAASQELAAFLSSESAGSNSAGEEQEYLVDDIMSSGRMQGMPAGADLKTLQDTRPHPNQLDLLRWLVRDIAWGVGIAPEVLWEISGLNGTATRYVMAETRRWVETQQDNLRGACQRMWTYFIAKEIKAGRLPQPQDERWWECEWVPQADPTIDRGRDTQAMIALLEKRLTTRKAIAASMGQDWKDVEAQLQREEEEIGGVDEPLSE